MAGNGRLRKSGQRRVRYAARRLQPIGHAAQAGPEHDADVGRADVELLGGGVRRPAHAIEERLVQLHDGLSSAAPSRNDVTSRRKTPGASKCDRCPAPAIATKRAPAIAPEICFISARGVT